MNDSSNRRQIDVGDVGVRFGDRLAFFAEAVDVKLDRFADVVFDFFACLTGGDARRGGRARRPRLFGPCSMMTAYFFISYLADRLASKHF